MAGLGVLVPSVLASAIDRICPRPWKNASYEVSEAL